MSDATPSPEPDATTSEPWQTWPEVDTEDGNFLLTPEIVDADGTVTHAPSRLVADIASSFAGLDNEEWASPQERAQFRFERLTTAFAATVALVAQMYRDEDWRYLRRDDGTEYHSLVEVCQVAMGKSAAMARRYVQGAKGLYLPLSEVMVEGTRLSITSGDVAQLGDEGMATVVEVASERLRTVFTPEEQAGIIDDVVRETKEARSSSRLETEGGFGEHGGDYNESYVLTDDDAVTSGEGFTGVADETGYTPRETGLAVPANSYFSDEDEDIITPLLMDAPLFYEEAAIDAAGFSPSVRKLLRALIMLENADMAEIAKALTFENRGLIVHLDGAQKTNARIRSLAETQPWVLRRLGS